MFNGAIATDAEPLHGDARGAAWVEIDAAGCGDRSCIDGVSAAIELGCALIGFPLISIT